MSLDMIPTHYPFEDMVEAQETTSKDTVNIEVIANDAFQARQAGQCLIRFSHSKEWAFQPSQPSFNSRVKSHFIFAILFYFFKLTQNNTELFSS